MVLSAITENSIYNHFVFNLRINITPLYASPLSKELLRWISIYHASLCGSYFSHSHCYTKYHTSCKTNYLL